MVGTSQVQNSAGGYAWIVDDWVRLDRFLVLGAEGGTYYIGERKVTVENAQAVRRCMEADGLRVVRRIVEISEAGRAPKNDPAIFALAMCAGLGDAAVRAAALEALPRVARIGTHLFHFLAAVEGFRGWGRGLRRAVANWYAALPTDRLAYQAVKYQNRNGWGHRDALRLAHPKPATPQHEAIYGWMVNGWSDVGATPDADAGLRLLWAYERGMAAAGLSEVLDLITAYGLPWEALPTHWLAQAEVWRALLPGLPMTALLRNLARMTANGLLTADAPETASVVERLTQVESLRRARIHPIAVLAALMTYRQGEGARGSLKWTPAAAISQALEQAFHLAFGNVEATGKRIVLALDVSGSMGGGEVAGVPGLTPRVASTAMALVTASVEPQHTIVGFCHQMTPLNIRPGQPLAEALRVTGNLPFGGTDCALPMLWALQKGIQADAFVVYTDSETWFGQVHPAQALADYRRQTGIPARLVVVGMVSNGFSIADPNDAGMLDVVGFDAATPQVIADFVAG
jgi:60 kDa SS-A/Ro ribonucleoprotein